jgi:hypothetical protein
VKGSQVPRARAIRLGAPTRPSRAARRIPWLLRLNLRLRGIDVQLSWLVAVAGVLACIAVIPRVHLDPSRYTRTTYGELTSRTAAEIDYVFHDPLGYEHWGHERIAVDSALRPGDRVSVHYDPSDPDKSTTRSQDDLVGPGSLALLAFPGAGLVLAALFALLRRRLIRLLRYGDVTCGKLRHEGFRSVAFAVDGQHVQLPFVTRELDDEQAVPVVFDRANPFNAVVLVDLPGRPRIDGDRVVTTQRVPLGVLLLPALVVAGTVVLLVMTLRA